jgi:hypothetical protein
VSKEETVQAGQAWVGENRLLSEVNGGRAQALRDVLG